MTQGEALLLLALELAERSEEEQSYALVRLTVPQLRTFRESWSLWAHEGQLAPDGEWRSWLVMAGRGFGKTRAGAEWVSRMARLNPGARIALVGATPVEAERVMVLGQSGLLAVAQTGQEPVWQPTRGLVLYANGSMAFVYSGANPDGLRGPEHHFAWCDELAKWAYPQETWDNLTLGLRLGDRPRAILTTTPRPIALLQWLVGAAGCAVTRGRTADNLNLHDDFVAAVTERYGGTRLGRQELDGELIEDVEGALWTRKTVEKSRVPPIEPGTMNRVVIGVDPPGSASGDACGIVVCGVDRGGTGYVLDDRSVSGLAPEGWAAAVVLAAETWGADRVVVETNQGGEMVESVLRSADCALPVAPVRARFGKGQRAEPVAIKFTKGQAKFAGAFPELEDELCGLTIGGGYEGPGRSPDRADAMVWAMAELLCARPRAEPWVRVL